jgi:phenylacetic acid degradation protein PaaD
MNKQLDIAKACAAKMSEADAASRRLGMTVEVTGVGQAEARVEVSTDMMNGFDVCHGGYIFALADTAFAFACNAYNEMTYAAGASIDFLRPARAGDKLLARANERHRGGRSGVYDVSVVNQDGDEVAVFTGRSVATRGPILSGAQYRYDT